MKATEVTAGLAESNGSLLQSLWRDSLHVTCGLTACTPGSAPGPTLGNEYGKTLPFYYCKVSLQRLASVTGLVVGRGPARDVRQVVGHEDDGGEGVDGDDRAADAAEVAGAADDERRGRARPHARVPEHGQQHGQPDGDGLNLHRQPNRKGSVIPQRAHRRRCVAK